FTLAELCYARDTLTIGLYGETGGKCVDRFGTHTVKPYRLLERFAVVFTTSIYFGNHIYHRSNGYTAAVIAYRNFIFICRDIYRYSGTHAEFVNGIVDDLFQKDMDTIVISRSIA